MDVNALTRWLTFGIAAVVVSVAAAQSPLPGSGAVATADRHTALIMGSVVDFRDGQPVPGAIVSLGDDRVIVDAQGRFAFLDLPKGDYTINATKLSFLDGAYGRQRPEGPSLVLTLAADERIGDLRIPLWKVSSVSGIVTDDTGAPLVDVPVDAMARVLIGGKWMLRHAGRARTDDRGVYRVGGLAGREYVVAAAPASILPPLADSAFAYPLMYYPGGEALSQAATVTLRVGENRLGIDLQRTLLKAARVSGTVLDPTGRPLAATVALTSRLGDAVASGGLDADEVTSDPSGHFTFSGVTPGVYELIVAKQPPQSPPNSPPDRLLWATARISVENSDVTGVALQTRTGARVSGRIVLEGVAGQRPPFDVTRRLTGFVESADGGLVGTSPTAPLEIDATARFSTRELVTGRYLFRMSQLPPGWALKSVSVLGRDVTRLPIAIDSDVAVTITLTQRAPEVRGTVRTPAGARAPDATVLLFPQDPKFWKDFGSAPPYVRAVRVARDATFRVADLPPGDYLVAAVIDDPAIELLETSTLEALARSALRFSVAEGDKRTFDLTTMKVVR